MKSLVLFTISLFTLAVAQRLECAEQKASPYRYEVYYGHIPEKYLPQFIQFDCELFREFPYLFVPTQEYLNRYWSALSTPTTIAIIALQDDVMIGGVIALSVEEEGEGHKEVISKHSCYQPGKSINVCWAAVAPEHQQRGIVRTIVQMGEKIAIEQGYTDAYWVTVVRSQNHPFKPINGFDLDKIWLHMGYKQTGIYELWQWPTRCGTLENEFVATIDNMVQFWHKQLTK